MTQAPDRSPKYYEVIRGEHNRVFEKAALHGARYSTQSPPPPTVAFTPENLDKLMGTQWSRRPWPFMMQEVSWKQQARKDMLRMKYPQAFKEK